MVGSNRWLAACAWGGLGFGLGALAGVSIVVAWALWGEDF